MLPHVTAIGYGEIDVDGGIARSWLSSENLLSNILDRSIDRTRFVSLRISSRDDVFEALRAFFNIDRFGHRAKK